MSILAITLGGLGFAASKTSFSQSHGHEQLIFKRAGFEHAFGSSLQWYRGKEDWLFLGNAYDASVAKLKLSAPPQAPEIASTRATFARLAKAGEASKTSVSLLIGPNKESIYPEYLPDKLVPSRQRYIDFYLDALKNVPNLTVYDPTEDLRQAKATQGALYWMTDTHWNNKGAFVAYSEFLKLLALPAPNVELQQGKTHAGDLIRISKLTDFPLHAQDNWDVVWKSKPDWQEIEIHGEQKTMLGQPTVVTNQKALSNKYVWVVGDSFTGALKQYFNATFKEVRYVGHWSQKLEGLPDELTRATRKPDMIVIVRVERSF